MTRKKTTWETSQAVERRPGQILERHDMAEDSTRQANLERAGINDGQLMDKRLDSY